MSASVAPSGVERLHIFNSAVQRFYQMKKELSKHPDPTMQSPRFRRLSYLRRFETYTTEINGHPFTLTLVGGRVGVIGDYDALADAIGPENILPVPGGVN